ncbi:MAG TPA: thymidine phosphorylase [Candidatus Eisenbacteria bacterium]
MIDARAFLRAKRDGKSHDAEDLRSFVLACARGEIPEYQLSAWLMAAFLNGLDQEETDALTEALIGSGRRYDWSALGRPVADKHSTGGVGDKISLVLAPLVAACDVVVPMVAGRGLGHTGGTIDKLESIPGFRTRLSAEAMEAQLGALGVVVVTQGPDVAPADGLLYALRDVTSTVEFEPYLVSSIVSKKVAEGADTLVYDVKCGSGALVKSREPARHLAERLVSTTRRLGRSAAALVTDMSQPLGSAVGNALEVRESVEVLLGRGPADVRALTLELATIMLERSKAEPDTQTARERATRALDSGAAWARFLALVEAQGGDPGSLEAPDGLARAPVTEQVDAPRSGRIAAIDAAGLGEVVVALGGGRRTKEQPVDPRVGILMRVRLGDRVAAGEPLAELHLAAADPAVIRRACSCFDIRDDAPPPPELILDRIA